LNRDFKGVWIPKEIWLDKQLTWMEKIVITEINSLDGIEGCFASNNYLAEFFNLTAGRISQIINSLIDKKYISAEYIRNGKEITKRVLRILNTSIKDSKEGIKYIKDEYLENAQDNNTYINNTSSNIKPKRKRNTFIPPSLEEIKQYIIDKRLILNAEKLYEYYTEGNWYDSNGKKVQNWKQKLLVLNNYQKPKDQPNEYRVGAITKRPPIFKREETI
jgi:hypothetical protein